MLSHAGYRVRRHGRGGRRALAGVRRGWSRFAAIGSHLSLVVLVLGAAIGTGFAEETRFGLFPGEQSLERTALVTPARGCATDGRTRLLALMLAFVGAMLLLVTAAFQMPAVHP